MASTLHNQPNFKHALLAGDILALSVAYLLTLFLVNDQAATPVFDGPFSVALAVGTYFLVISVMLFTYLVNNLYKRQTFRSRYLHMTRLLKSIVISIAVILPVFVIFGWQFFSVHGRILLLLFLTNAFFGSGILRLAILKYFLVSGTDRSKRSRLLIVGGDSAAAKVVHALERDERPEFEVIGLVDDYKTQDQEIFDGWRNLGRLEDLPRLLARLSPDEILIAIDNAPYSRLVRVVNACLKTGRVVRIFSDRLKTLAQRLGAEEYADGIPVIMLSQTQPTRYSRTMRRVVDVVLSTVALLLFSPLFAAIVVGIKLSSPGPVIFRQTRVGLGGRPFNFYKFRSMHLGTSDDRHQEFTQQFIRGEKGEASDEDGTQIFKIEEDSRIFPFGHFIRRTSLDEFPQLLNVLKGDMGLVGPRPCLPYEWEAYDDWHRGRLSVVPGCTGLWQVLGRSTVTFEDMVIMDLYYISNYSLMQDLRILYKTIPEIFFSKGGL